MIELAVGRRGERSRTASIGCGSKLPVEKETMLATVVGGECLLENKLSEKQLSKIGD